MAELEKDLQEKNFPVGIIAVVLVLLMVVIGVVFFVVAKPFAEKKPTGVEAIRLREERGPLETYDHPLFTEQQQQLLISIGIDVRDIPEEISPELEECLVEALGAERFKEIRSGAELTTEDFFKGNECF